MAVVGAGGTGGFLVLVPLVPELELVVEDAVAFRVRVAAPRVAFAFSTMLEMMFDDEPLVVCPLTGEAGRAIADFIGEAGLSSIVFTGDCGRSIARGTIRTFEEVGERTCPA